MKFIRFVKKERVWSIFPIFLLFSSGFFPTFSPIDYINENQLCSDIINQFSIDISDTLKTDGWPMVYDYGEEEIATNIVLDNEENIIVAGHSYLISREEIDFLTVKYNPNGSVIWASLFDGGLYDYCWDMVCDSQNNIIILGFNSSLDDDPNALNITLFLIKYNANGEEQWNKTLKEEKDVFPGGIAVDSQDNIILTLGSGDLNAMMFLCKTIKYDSQGVMQWEKTFEEDMLSFGSDVEITQNDEIIVGGLSASFFGQGWFTMKYDSYGNMQWVHRYDCGNQPYEVEVDNDGNIIITGQEYSPETESSSWLTLKSDPNGNLLWKYLYDGADHEYVRGAKIDSQGNLITLGSIVKNNSFQSCFIIQNPSGDELCMKKPDFSGSYFDLTLDAQNQVIATGAIITSNENDSYNSDYFTTMISDFTPPVYNVKTPIPGYIYLFDNPLFSFGNEAIVIGKLTFSVEVDDPIDVKQVEFYVNGILMETTDTVPYDWVWDQSGFGHYDIEIHVYDYQNTIKRDIQSVWKIF